MSNPVAYFEIAGPDVQRLAAFYAQVFGWQSRPGPFPGYLSLGSEVGTERGAGFRQEAEPERSPIRAQSPTSNRRWTKWSPAAARF